MSEAVIKFQTQLEFWINREIPRWLDTFKTYEEFMKVYPEAAASCSFKAIAWGMAKERWKIIDGEPVRGY